MHRDVHDDWGAYSSRVNGALHEEQGDEASSHQDPNNKGDTMGEENEVEKTVETTETTTSAPEPQTETTETTTTTETVESD